MLALNWPLVIGEKFANDSHPEKLFFQKGENTNAQLTLSVNSYKAIYFQQIQNELIDRINTYLGYHAIGALKFVQRPLVKNQTSLKKRLKLSEMQKSALEQNIENIEDTEMKVKLKSIGEYVYDKHNRKSA